MKKFILLVFAFNLIWFIPLNADSGVQGHTSIYRVTTYIVGKQRVEVVTFVGCDGPSTDCLPMVTVTGKRIKEA